MSQLNALHVGILLKCIDEAQILRLFSEWSFLLCDLAAHCHPLEDKRMITHTMLLAPKQDGTGD